MANVNGSNNTGIIAVLVIFLVVALGVGVFVFRGQIFGAAEKKTDQVDIKVEVNETIPPK